MLRTGAMVACAVVGGACLADDSFVNWESPHVSPVALTPDGSRLLAVNTPDNRLEVFDVTGGTPVSLGSVPVGLDPVSVRARTNSEAWVVNHVSDSISIVNLSTMNVVASISTGDEPADVVFAQGKAFVSVSQLDEVRVFDLAHLNNAPTILEIAGEEPRALATDGQRVYAAIFESGNLSAVLPHEIVSSPVNPYPDDQNPPPNDGDEFSPPINPANPAAPEVALIVQRTADGPWLDDNGADWSAAMTWDLVDHDVAIIDATTLGVTYQGSLMNLDMAIGVKPNGDVTVVGTDAINRVRFEPNVNGVFVRVMMGTFDPDAPGSADVVDLNPHLDYSTPTVAQEVRDESVGDPRAVVWSANGQTGYVAGMGSNNVIKIGASGARLAEIAVGEGPTGLALGAGRLYVLNKFEGSISVIDVGQVKEVAKVAFYDPSPAAIKVGRRHLYDTHATSGLGQASCASCHVDGRFDALAWDLGDPSGEVKPFNQVCNFGLGVPGDCEDWHPMKGPMVTQTLFGIIGSEPLHWRGDREGLSQFNPAFESLMGDDEQLTVLEMGEFVDFLATLTPAPNPNRNLDNSLKSAFPGGGNAQIGETLFTVVKLDGGAVSCNFCHTVPTGTNGGITSASQILDTQSMKIAQLRNLHEKTGLDFTSMENTRGVGYTHDGAVDTLLEFLQFPTFTFVNDSQRQDVVAFLMSFSTDTHAGVGTQATLASVGDLGSKGALIAQMTTLAQSGAVGLVVKGVVGGEARGYAFLGSDSFQSDREGEVVTTDDLLLGVGPGAEITLTLVPAGTQARIGVDRDLDGYFDRDERDVCDDPGDPASYPGGQGSIDVNGDLSVNILDFVALQLAFVNGEPNGDFNGDGQLNILDFVHYQLAFTAGCE